MSGILARLILVCGFCLGAVGAAGFSEPVEPLAWPLFLAGIAGTAAGGLLLRSAIRRGSAEGGGDGLSRRGLAEALAGIAADVVRLDEEKGPLDRRVLCERIDAILSGPCFELGGRSEEYARELGPGAFARIWEGFAVCERLLARTWSIATDDHLEEALAELPRARAQILLAAEEAAREAGRVESP